MIQFLLRTYLRFEVWRAQRSCDHSWRPALTSKSAARYCEDCEKIEPLTDGEFYAYFGRMPIL